MAAKGYRMINGKAYLLNGTVSGWTPEVAKANASAEAASIRAKGTADTPSHDVNCRTA